MTKCLLEEEGWFKWSCHGPLAAICPLPRSPWPSDRYFHPLPWCCYRVVTELCAVFVHFCVILTPSALTLWRLLTPSHFHSPSEHSCYKNIAMFTLSSPPLFSPRGHVSPDTELNIIMRPPTTWWGPVSANQSSDWRPLTNERSGIPSLVFRQWWVRGRHVWRAESCVWIWGEMCEGSLAIMSTCPGQGEQLGQIYTLIITRRTGRRQGRPSELGKQRN